MTQTIKIPNNAIVLLIGPSASGKSTFANNSFVHSSIVSSDHYREVVSDDANDQNATQLAFDLVHAVVKARLTYKKMVVIDATNLKISSRKQFVDLAKQFNVPLVYLVFNTPVDRCLTNNKYRQRQVLDHVIIKHAGQMECALKEIEREGATIYHIGSDDFSVSFLGHDFNSDIKIELINTDNSIKHITAGSFVIIGDVHGCYDSLMNLTDKINFNQVEKLIFVGDLTDRGMQSVKVLRWVMNMVERGIAECVLGNHCNKLMRYLKGNKIRIADGLQRTIDDIDSNCSEDEKAKILRFLQERPYQLILHTPSYPDCIVTHAGIPWSMVGQSSEGMRKHAIYGEHAGKDPLTGYPIRTILWHEQWPHDENDPIQVHGHTVTRDVIEFSQNNIFDIDTGCVFEGYGKLTAMLYPSRTFIQV